MAKGGDPLEPPKRDFKAVRKISERCTTKFTVVATPWAMTKPITWTGSRSRPWAVSRVNSRLNSPTCRAKVKAYSSTTARKRRCEWATRKVQRRLIRYAVVVPATKESALAGVWPSPSCISSTRSPKSTTADRPPAITNRVSWARSGSGLSRSATGSSTGWGSWVGWSVIRGHPQDGHCGDRLALNAAIPSRRSGEKAASCQAWSSRARPVARSASNPSRYGALGRPQADRGVSGDRRGEVAGRRPGGARRHQPVDQTQRVRLGRPDPAAGQHQVQGPVASDPPGQQLGAAAARDQAEPDLRQAEGGALGGDDQVAGQGELVAAAQGEPLDRGHGGQTQLPDGGEGLDEHRPLGAELVVVQLVPLLEVRADAERVRQGAGQHHGTDLRSPPPGCGPPRRAGGPARSTARCAPRAGPSPARRRAAPAARRVRSCARAGVRVGAEEQLADLGVHMLGVGHVAQHHRCRPRPPWRRGGCRSPASDPAGSGRRTPRARGSAAGRARSC